VMYKITNKLYKYVRCVCVSVCECVQL
jgi:hypothetical protein